MNEDQIQQLRIKAAERQRPRGAIWSIWLAILLLSAGALYLARPWDPETKRLGGSVKPPGATGSPADAAHPAPASAEARRMAAPPLTGAVLTVSGYIINRERIEISPRFLGMVKWIGVKKGDAVTNGQVVVRLDDAEYLARLKEAEARRQSALVAVEKAELDYRRAEGLVRGGAEMQKALDDARLQLEAARSAVKEVEGQIEQIRVYLEWTVIRSPINGVVLEKLVDANELVTPQSFGGARGPSTALLAVADLSDLQVEIDLNEADLAKVRLRQRCRVSPEAYPDKHFEGYVAEIAPEASRQKGTLQVKVQILQPDRFLTPELSARVDFLADDSPSALR